MLEIRSSAAQDQQASSSPVTEIAPPAEHREQKPWYALSVRSRHEKTVAHFLESFGYVSFFPTYKARRLWSDRIKEVEAPLFPGYLFCRFDIYNRLPILMIPGVQHIVGGTKFPAPIDTSEINALQTVVQSGAAREPWPFLQAGDRLRIEHGSLAGVEGILLQVKGRHRLVLSVTLLQRSVSVDVDSAWVSLLARESSAARLRVRLTQTSTQPAV
jgi:transcription antitermination factor NusG